MCDVSEAAPLDDSFDCDETGVVSVGNLGFHSARLKVMTRFPCDPGPPTRPILTVFWNPETSLPVGAALLPRWPDPYEAGAAAVDLGDIVHVAERLRPGCTETSLGEDVSFRVLWRPISRASGGLLREVRNGARWTDAARRKDRQAWRRWFLGTAETLYEGLGRPEPDAVFGYETLLAALQVAFAGPPLASSQIGRS